MASMSSSPSERHNSGALRPKCGGASVGDPWTPHNRRPPAVWRIPCQRAQGMTNQKQRSVRLTTLGEASVSCNTVFTLPTYGRNTRRTHLHRNEFQMANGKWHMANGRGSLNKSIPPYFALCHL